MGKTVQANGLFGRVGVEGRVSGPNALARGFAGYLEYDTSLNPTVENNIDIDNLSTTSTSVALLDDFIRISKGIPWAFYTENQSKFKDDVTITSQLIAETEPLVFSDTSGPVSDPVVEINPTASGSGSLEPNSIIANDFIATDDLAAQFFMREAREDFNDYDDYEVFDAIVDCPPTPTVSIRVGCDGGVIASSASPTNTPYLGSEPTSARGCKAYARKPIGNVPGYLSAFAYCWRPQ